MPDAGVDRDPGDRPLARNRDFRLLAISQGISSVGDLVAVTALPLLVLQLTGSAVALGVVLAIQALTDFAFGLFAGALADRGDRKRMMVAADVGRAFLTALIPISAIAGGPTMAIIVAVAAPLSVFRSLFRAGYISSLPNLVGRSHLARANGILESIYSSSVIVGPVIAGFLSAAIGPGATLAIDAASFAVSAIGLFLMTTDLHAPLDRPPSHILADVREGIAYVVRHPVLRSAVLLFGLYSAVVAPLIVAMAVRITRDLGQSEEVFGIVVASFGFGAVAGALVVARLGRRANVVLVMLGGIAFTGLTILGLAAFDTVAAMVLFTLLGGLSETLVSVTYVTLRAAVSPDALLGRIGSTARVFSLGVQPIGLLAGGLLIDSIGGTSTIAVIGLAACVLALAFAPVRALRHASLAPVQAA
jgi:MFS family permease